MRTNRFKNLFFDGREDENVAGEITALIAEQRDLEGLTVIYANLYSCDFSRAKIKSAFFNMCGIANSNFLNAKASGISFLDCDLEGAFFAKADLRGSVFRKSRLRKADFSGALLEAANLYNCEMDYVKFNDARDLDADVLMQNNFPILRIEIEHLLENNPDLARDICDETTAMRYVSSNYPTIRSFVDTAVNKDDPRMVFLRKMFLDCQKEVNYETRTN